LFHADDVNILCERVHTIKTNTEASLVGRKDDGLEVNADKTKYMVMSRNQKAGRNHNNNLIRAPLKGWKSSNIWEQP